MIPMSCPSCGRRGNVPLDRLNTRMHCKKCDAVFHLDATGKAVLGEPPSSKKAKGGKGAKARDKNEPLDPIGIVAEKLSHTPKPVWMTGLVLFVLASIYYGYQWFGPEGPTEEISFNQKILTSCQAMIDKDLPTLEKMATSDSRGEIVQAVDAFATLAGPLPKAETLSIIPGAPPSPPSGLVSSTVMPPQPAEPLPAGVAPQVITLDIAWIKGEARWFIDGKATLEAINERVKMAKSTPARK